MSTATPVSRPAAELVAKPIAAARLSGWLQCREEFALLDVREAGQFGEGHLFYAIPLPFSRLELDIGRLVPKKATPIVICDDGEHDLAQRAGRALREAGYQIVWFLQDGVRGWADSGRHLFKGVNLPSKAFGELVEQRLHTPRISAPELAQRQARGDNLLVLDGRPVSEFHKMSIPGAVCCPNGELALRIAALAPDPETTIVINCAGRTRSIIGAQTLINLGVPNPVFALENGTQGWYLSDLALEHGQVRQFPERPDANTLQASRELARALAQRHAVPVLPVEAVQACIDDPIRNCFVLDVRTAAEFAAGSLAGAQHAPGGQLLQATDQYVGVRNARLVLLDSEGVRALVVASWLRQMGHDACVLAQGIHAPLRLPAQARLTPELSRISAAAVFEMIAAGKVLVIDVRPSMSFRKAHVPGSVWTTRSFALSRLGNGDSAAARTMVLVSDSPEAAALYARDFEAAGLGEPLLLDGGLEAWLEAGLPVEASPHSPADDECIDFLFFVHDRHDGNKAAARQYLAWETGLLAMLEDHEIRSFDPR